MKKSKTKKIIIFLALFCLVFFIFEKKAWAFETLAEWTFPNNPDDAVVDKASLNNLEKSINAKGITNLSFNYNGYKTNSARATGWQDGDGEKYWQIEFNSLNYNNLRISSRQRSSNTGPKNFKLQYKIDTNENWNDIIGSDILVKDNFISGFLDNLALPKDCDNKKSVYLRWIMSSNLSVIDKKVASVGASNIDDIIIMGMPIEVDDEKNKKQFHEDNTKEIEDRKVCDNNSANVKINEVFPNTDKEEDEFVELFNNEKTCVDISNWIIKDNTNLSNHKYIIPNGTILESGEYFYIKRKLYLNNDTDIVYLLNKALEEKDEIKYEKAGKNKNYSYSFEDQNWFWTLFPTPGEKNKFKREDKKDSHDSKIYFSEILPNPKKGENEYIEIYNNSEKDIDLSGWKIKDAAKSSKAYIFPEGSMIKKNDFLVVYNKDFKFALNNSGLETIYLFNFNNVEISTISYFGSKRGVSYNFDGQNWRWSRFLTPSEKNKFNSLPKVKIKKDKKIYVNAYAYFEVKISDSDRDNIKAVWNFGDGRRSYKKKTRHKYMKSGKYEIALNVFDGSEDKIKKFTVEAENFPKRKVKIVALSPNPIGQDSRSEWIEVKNMSKKKVNLKGWSVANGWKNMQNHSIREDFIIEPGKNRKLTREYSLFVLNNKKAKIELRYPNMERADKVKYNKEKDGVDEEEKYIEDEKKWKWEKLIKNVELNVETETTDVLVQDHENKQHQDGVINEQEIKNVEQNILREDESQNNALTYNDVVNDDKESAIAGDFIGRDVSFQSDNPFLKNIAQSNYKKNEKIIIRKNFSFSRSLIFINLYLNKIMNYLIERNLV